MKVYNYVEKELDAVFNPSQYISKCNVAHMPAGILDTYNLHMLLLNAILSFFRVL